MSGEVIFAVLGFLVFVLILIWFGTWIYERLYLLKCENEILLSELIQTNFELEIARKTLLKLTGEEAAVTKEVNDEV